jgi:Calx-beta domain
VLLPATPAAAATVTCRPLQPPAGIPSLVMGDATVKEGDEGTVQATFTVVRLGPTEPRVVATFATRDDTATSSFGASFPGRDYQATVGTLVFDPGVTQESASVRVFGDDVDEPDERFLANLTAVTTNNAVISKACGVATIVNDDRKHVIMDDVQLVEGDSDQFETFTAHLPKPDSQTVQVQIWRAMTMPRSSSTICRSPVS